MQIILDTTVIVADFQLQGTLFRLVFGAMPTVGCALHVPEVVVDEAVNKFAEEVRSAAQELRRTLSTVRRLTGREIPSPMAPAAAERLASRFAKQLKTSLAARGVL